MSFLHSLPSQSPAAQRTQNRSHDQKWRHRTASAGGGGSAPQARPAPPSGGEAAAPSSLDKGTIYIPQGEKPQDKAYRVIMRPYGGDLAEASVTINRPPKRRKLSTHAPRQLTEADKAENADRANRRARTAVRQTIMAAGLDHLLTLTYRENQTDPTLAWKHFSKFCKLLRKRRSGRPFPFVAVLERQKRGAIHIHVAVHGFQDVKLLRALWHQVVGDDNGNIDVQFFRQRLPMLARYLSKYITKGIGDEHIPGDHRYKRSRRITVPKLVSFLPYTADIEECLKTLFDALGTSIRFKDNRLSREGPKWLWACSW